MINTDAEAVCREVYAETRTFYRQVAPHLGDAACGFRILYGQPLVAAPILYLGYQPGGGSGDIEDAHHTTWPDRCDYAHETWPLAKRMRTIWGAPFLACCTGLNLIFFRAKNVREWRAVDPGLRIEMEQFSRERAERIVRALAPKRIVVIGLGTLDRLKVSGQIVVTNGGRTLAKSGELWGMPAIGVIHLSGARISLTDLDHLTHYFQSKNGM